MHCRSCEVLVQESLEKVAGVKTVKVSIVKATALIEASDETDQKKLEQAVLDAGYQVGWENKKWLNTNWRIWRDILLSAGIFGLVILLFYTLNFSPEWALAGSTESLAGILAVGLVAGFSTCMALTGGLIVSLTARYNQKHPEASGWRKFQPHLYFNLGRLVSYFILGGVIGSVGAILKISPAIWAVLTIIVGSVMLFLGLQLTEAVPKLSNWSLAWPSKISKIFKKEERAYSHWSAGILGALTFFLPCGFTQVIQLYAMTTGNFWTGAVVMTVFALGTLIGLLVAGLATSFVGGKTARIFFHVIGVLLILFALANIINGWNLLGAKSWINFGEKVVLTGETQVIKATYSLRQDILPNSFIVKAGNKVRFEVESLDTGIGCMSTIMIPGLYNKPIDLVKGKLIVMEFVAKAKGTYPITCAMGVRRGELIVE